MKKDPQAVANAVELVHIYIQRGLCLPSQSNW